MHFYKRWNPVMHHYNMWNPLFIITNVKSSNALQQKVDTLFHMSVSSSTTLPSGYDVKMTMISCSTFLYADKT